MEVVCSTFALAAINIIVAVGALPAIATFIADDVLAGIGSIIMTFELRSLSMLLGGNLIS